MKKAPKASPHRQLLTEAWRNVKAVFADAKIDLAAIADNMCAHSLNIAKEQSQEIKKAVTAYAAKNPLEAVGIAFIIGAVVGYRLKR